MSARPLTPSVLPADWEIGRHSCIGDHAAWVEVAGKPAQIYSVKHSVELNKSTAFIESSYGASFTIHVLCDTPRREWEHDRMYHLYIDGRKLGGFISQRVELDNSVAFLGVSGQGYERDYVFGAPNFTDDPAPASCQTEQAGTIEIRAFKIKDVCPAEAAHETPELPHLILDEAEHKAEIAHLASLGKKRETEISDLTYSTFTLITPLDAPEYTWEFRYRSRDFLEVKNHINIKSKQAPLPRLLLKGFPGPWSEPKTPDADLHLSSDDDLFGFPWPTLSDIFNDDFDAVDGDQPAPRLTTALRVLLKDPLPVVSTRQPRPLPAAQPRSPPALPRYRFQPQPVVQAPQVFNRAPPPPLVRRASPPPPIQPKPHAQAPRWVLSPLIRRPVPPPTGPPARLPPPPAPVIAGNNSNAKGKKRQIDEPPTDSEDSSDGSDDETISDLKDALLESAAHLQRLTERLAKFEGKGSKNGKKKKAKKAKQ
ncbi:hypothetical protein RQP46_000219 [Phenoliferia psychrophenolica]